MSEKPIKYVDDSSSVYKNMPQKHKELFSKQKFVDVNLNDYTECASISNSTTSQRYVNNGNSNLLKNVKERIPNTKNASISSNNKNIDTIDKLIVHKISNKQNKHRRIKSGIDVSTLASYNFRLMENDHDNVFCDSPTLQPINDNNADSFGKMSVKNSINTSKSESLDTSIRLLSAKIKNFISLNDSVSETKSLNCSFSKNSLQQKAKLAAETKADLLMEYGAIGLPMVERPPGLPPKPKNELELQKKLYNSIVKNNIRKINEKTKIIVDETIKTNNKEQKMSNDSIFWNTVINNWNSNGGLSSKHVRKKIICGIPTYTRGKIWKLCSQNKISIAKEVFDQLFYQDYSFNDDDKSISTDSSEKDIYSSILIDVERTFTPLKLFQKDYPLHKDLCQLLYTFHLYNSNVGYTQGMSYPMAVFFLNLEPYDCFVCFNNLISQPIFTALYTCDYNKLQEIYIFFETVMSLENPKLVSHIHAINLSPSLYFLDWIMSCFCKIFTLEVVSRIFDNYFVEGTITFFKSAMMILQYHEKDILSNYDPISCAQLLGSPLRHLSEDQIFQRINQFDNYNQLHSQMEMCIKFK